MSLIPMLFSNWWEQLDESHSILDQHFGLGLRPNQLIPQGYHSLFHRPGRQQTPQSAPYYRPWGELLRRGDGGSSVVKADKDQFKVMLDVQQFKPEEIKVKVIDKCVVIEAKHEEKRDEYGWISRQFERRYLIPDQCNVEEVSSNLSSDRVLTITAPRKEQPKIEGETQIKIQHTGKPALKATSAQEQASTENTVGKEKSAS